jgi:hypothetical protein
MKVDLMTLISSVSNIKILTSDINSTQYIMLDFQKDLINVCYSDGKISYIEKIEAESDENDVEDKVVVDLDALIQKLDVYRPTAELQVDPLIIKFDGEDALSMTCKKFINQIQLDENGDMIDNGNGEALTARVESSNMRTNLKYHKINDSIKFSMTTRMDYSAIFAGEGWITSGVKELKSLFTKLSKTDGARECYLSPKMSAGFAVGTGYTIFLPVTFGIVPCSLTVSSVKKLTQIISKFKDETVNIISEGSQFLKVTSEDSRVGIVFEQCPAVRQQLSTLGTFRDLDYSNQGLLFIKAALADMVRGTITVSGAKSDTDIGFSIKDNVVVASTIKKGTGNGIDNLDVYAYSVIGDINQFDGYKINVSFDLLKLILDNCDGNAIEFGFAENGDDKYLRITDISKQGKEATELGNYFICV